jgi:hypothetical protein
MFGRKTWNTGCVLVSFFMPFFLGLYESTFRDVAGDKDLTFFAPELASAGLALLLPCFIVGPEIEAQGNREMWLAGQLARWEDIVLLLALIWFVVGGLLWAVSLDYAIKGSYPSLWPAWSFGATLAGTLGAIGSQTLVFYAVAMLLAIGKLAKP